MTVFFCFPEEKPCLNQGLVCDKRGSQAEPCRVVTRPDSACSPTMGRFSLRGRHTLPAFLRAPAGQDEADGGRSIPSSAPQALAVPGEAVGAPHGASPPAHLRVQEMHDLALCGQASPSANSSSSPFSALSETHTASTVEKTSPGCLLSSWNAS